MSRFEIRDQFYLDGEPFQIVSGAVHYFRVPRAYWRDRLEKLKAMGCGCVETYVPWDLHEPRKGVYDFSGDLDVGAFLREAQDLGLWAIVRPSPYICAEWDFGGLPAWLLAGDDFPLRSSEGPFLSHVADYYRALFPHLAPMQIDQGGNVILFQVENEFAAWGKDDPAYLAGLAALMRENGVTVPFLTSDNLLDGDTYPLRGMTEGALPTLNFGSGAEEKLPLLGPHVHGGPLMVTEFWVGWYDSWGDPHHTAPVERAAADLDAILSRGSVNFYMFHGGTDFGLLNGANDDGHLLPLVTSYDYDAPLTEDGRTTPKYEAFRSVIGRYREIPQVELTTRISRRSYGRAVPQGRVSLFDALGRISEAVPRREPVSMERLGQSYGYVLYRARIGAGTAVSTLELTGAADRARIFLDGESVLTLYDRELSGPRSVRWTASEGRLELLMEHMGRVNFGPRVAGQRKGIDGPVLLDGVPLEGWEIFPLPMEDVTGERLGPLDPPGTDAPGPAFHVYTFDVDAAGDTFLDLSGWGKGCVLLDGACLGRYWEIGPQRRLYVPAPLLREGTNELVIFETEGKEGPPPLLTDAPDLG